MVQIATPCSPAAPSSANSDHRSPPNLQNRLVTLAQALNKNHVLPAELKSKADPELTNHVGQPVTEAGSDGAGSGDPTQGLKRELTASPHLSSLATPFTGRSARFKFATAEDTTTATTAENLSCGEASTDRQDAGGVDAEAGSEMTLMLGGRKQVPCLELAHEKKGVEALGK